ncbi:MAG: CtsR family transcriptional regulator, partial [Oscillospiraceae bacterium]
MAISDMIAGFILQVLEGTDGVAELQRSELAQRFNCVPSQINYVISTRFSPEHGYIVESRRGGGGYIRIRRVQYEPSRLAMHTVNAIGYELDEATASALISNLI